VFPVYPHQYYSIANYEAGNYQYADVIFNNNKVSKNRNFILLPEFIKNICEKKKENLHTNNS